MLSFSNVIAVIALFIALGGSVYAASKINGKQIKPKSIPANRLKPASITGKQVKPGSLTGREVVGSSLSGVNASSLATVQYVTSATVALDGNTPPQHADGTASCPSGMKVIGGGATMGDDEKGYVNDSAPTGDRSGWTATGFAYNGETTTMIVTAICTAVSSASG
jgi:hypothetical protein